MKYMIIADNLTKRFKKEKGKGIIEALKGISFKVRKGEIFAIMGPNGAGKTTLLKILSCVIRPDEGEAWINGYHIIKERSKAKASCNLIIGGSWLGLHYAYTVKENLMFFGRLYGIPKEVLLKRIEFAAELLDLRKILNKEAIFLSTGEMHKAILAKMLLIKTPVLLLDEPTRSLDPVLANKVRAILTNIISKEYKITILMTSHQAVEVETLADRVAFLNKGKIIACDTPSNLKKKIRKLEKISIKLNRVPSEKLISKIKKLDIEKLNLNDELIEIYTRELEYITPNLIELIKKEDLKIVSLSSERISLEDVFKFLVEGECYESI